jgi:hypothetical protein
MKEKNKNKNDTLSEFLRYTRGEMTKREENAFQKKLQKDPFAAEAAEGFSEISPREAADDMDRLEKKLKNRIKPRQRVVYYRIAASVAVLMIISSVYLIVERNKPATQLSEATVKSTAPEEVADSNLLTGPIIADSKSLIATPLMETEQQITNDTTGAALTAKIENPSITEKTEVPAMIEKKDSNLYIAELNEPVKKSDIALSANDEVVATGYGAAKSSRAATGAVFEAEKEKASYSPPQPVNGKESFDNYIRENIQKPAISDSVQNAIVVATFIVRSTGNVDSIKVVSSPGNEFSKEAIRLIKEGPSWKPAENNGEKIDDEVSVRLVFK